MCVEKPVIFHYMNGTGFKPRFAFWAHCIIFSLFASRTQVKQFTCSSPLNKKWPACLGELIFVQVEMPRIELGCNQ